MRLDCLASDAGFKMIAVPEPDREVEGVYIGDLLSWVMGRAAENDLWLTIMTNINVVAVASLTGVSAVLLCEGCLPDDDVINAAKAKGINLLMTDKRIYEASLAVAEALRAS